MIRDKSGIISIFLALIILPVYSIAILTIDIAKVMMAKNHLQTASESAVYSTLANYDKELFKKYGIYAISDFSYANDYGEYVLTENIESSSSNFYKARIDNFEILKKEDDLLIKNLKHQILEYMKLYGPYNIGKGIINLVDLTMSSKKYNEVLNNKFDYEEEYSKVNENFTILVKNFIQYDKSFQNINERFLNLNKDIKFIQDVLKNNNFNQDVFQSESDISIPDEITNEIKKYNEKNKKLKSDLGVMNVLIKDIITQLNYLSDETVNLQLKLDKWGNSINTLPDSDVKNNFNSEYKTTKFEFTKENIDSLLKKINDHSETASKMIEILSNKNIYNLEIKTLNNIFEYKFNIDDSKKLPSLNNFKIYKYIVDKQNVEKINKEKNKKGKEYKSSLEKFAKKFKEVETVKNKEYIQNFISEKDIERIINQSSSLSLDISSNSTISNYKKIFNNTISIIPSSKNNLLQNIYIASYIVDKFNNKLEEKSDFTSQIEYILFGNSFLNKNNNSVGNYIFGIRFLLNSIYAYTNSDLKLEANAIATALLGWTGFGVPILRSLILSLMSFGESIIDLETINGDKNLEAFKNKSTWKVSISSLPSLLANKISDIANSTIDNIYDSILNYSNKGIDNLNNNIDEFINQSIDGLSQSIISEVLSPVQSVIFNKINNSISVSKDYLNEVLSDIENSINSDNSSIRNIKFEIFNLIRDSIKSNLGNIDEINVEEYFQNLVKMVEKEIKNYTSTLSNNLKSNIQSTLKSTKIKQKEQVSNYIDSYLKEIGLESSVKIKGANSGLSFKYKDYLILITLFKLMTGNEREIFERMALIMEYEIRKINPKFYIDESYSSFSISARIKVNTSIIDKYIFIDVIENTVIGGY